MNENFTPSLVVMHMCDYIPARSLSASISTQLPNHNGTLS
jgi:hypothetical protein